MVLAPTTAQPPPQARLFDDLGPTATDRAMIAACPVTFPWNVLGWPSINIPAGFTSDGLPIGVQLMGPANSEPLLVSLAAELEAINGWADKQPDVWWNTPLSPASPEPSITATSFHRSMNVRRIARRPDWVCTRGCSSSGEE